MLAKSWDFDIWQFIKASWHPLHPPLLGDFSSLNIGHHRDLYPGVSPLMRSLLFPFSGYRSRQIQANDQHWDISKKDSRVPCKWTSKANNLGV